MLWETILLAQREIRRNKMRSSLTILGIVIGVAAVIIMVTLGRGATAKVTSDIAKLGSNMLLVRPGQGFRGPGGARASADAFDAADVAALEREIPSLKAVAPTAAGTPFFGLRLLLTRISMRLPGAGVRGAKPMRSVSMPRWMTWIFSAGHPSLSRVCPRWGPSTPKASAAAKRRRN